MYSTISNFIIEHHKHSFRTYISVRIMWRWTSRISSSTTGWDTFRSRWTFVSLASNWTFFPGRWCSAWRGAPSRTGATPGRRGTSRDRYKETIRRFPHKGNLSGGEQSMRWTQYNTFHMTGCDYGAHHHICLSHDPCDDQDLHCGFCSDGDYLFPSHGTCHDRFCLYFCCDFSSCNPCPCIHPDAYKNFSIRHCHME